MKIALLMREYDHWRHVALRRGDTGQWWDASSSRWVESPPKPTPLTTVGPGPFRNLQELSLEFGDVPSGTIVTAFLFQGPESVEPADWVTALPEYADRPRVTATLGRG